MSTKFNSHIIDARERHHRQAQLLARGIASADVAAQCGTNEARLKRLLADPAFRNLIATYRKAHSATDANARFYLCAA